MRHETRTTYLKNIQCPVASNGYLMLMEQKSQVAEDHS